MTSPDPLPRPVGAADLIRAVGLMADGPVTWGRPVPSRKPGVYVVEWPESLADAPVELTNVGRWLERLPGFRLDGHRPTSREIAARLHEFWLPGQTVLYIGRTRRPLAKRIGEYYETPLGANGPHAGGAWLKTLRGLERSRVWWAETEAQEEYEDALFTAFAVAVDASVDAAPRLRDRSVILPFANLQDATGTRKDHGLSGTMEPRPPESPPPGTSVVEVPAGAADGAEESSRGRPMERRAPVPAPVPASRTTGTASRLDLDAVNAALQSIACRRLMRELTVADAAAELSALGLLRGVRGQPVAVLRDLLKQGLIAGGSQDADRRWTIRCLERI
ncbi:MAG TPA: hypothetical protein VEG29_00975 [Candidatus Binatia bacterium]|nr:hypothetical protein [Candidatus Binatia bacterium]